jgi:hypothetical protein
MNPVYAIASNTEISYGETLGFLRYKVVHQTNETFYPTVITLHILNLTIFFCEHFLHCWFTPTNMTILYCYNSICYIILIFFSLNVVIKCNGYLYITTCWCMEYKIVCKCVERTFVSWNNLFPIQMLYS